MASAADLDPLQRYRAPADFFTKQGWVLVALQNAFYALSDTKTPARLALWRVGVSAALGAYCAFLCSEHAGFITGQTLRIDGGASVG